MAKSRDSKHAHGPSEVLSREEIVAALGQEQLQLAAQLRRLREDRAWSREVAAESIGIHAVQLARMEAGSANVTLATLVAVALAYNVSLASLFARATRR